MTAIDQTAFAALDAEERLLNAVFKGDAPSGKRYGFRGDIALKFPAQLADEKRPPEIVCEQVIAACEAGSTQLSFFTGFLLSFENLRLLAEVLGEALTPSGKYFVFCDNVDLAKRYLIEYAGVTFYVLPIDEATVYNETLELLYLERTELKRMDTGAKLDAIVEAAPAFKPDRKFVPITYEEALKVVGPVRDPYANRPV
ncbi:MAG: hypothetical protein QM639_17305 [Rhodocyclaceae bacterium]|jgi:hypothetical protein